jgi:hypothetical protein
LLSAIKQYFSSQCVTPSEKIHPHSMCVLVQNHCFRGLTFKQHTF